MSKHRPPTGRDVELAAARARANARVARHQATLFPGPQIRALMASTDELLRQAQARGATRDECDRIEDIRDELGMALRDGEVAARWVAEATLKLETANRRAQLAAGDLAELVGEPPAKPETK